MNIIEHIRQHKDALEHIEQNIQLVERVAAEIISTFERGNKVFVAGNGGSAADAQHFVAELVGRFKMERPGLPAIALTTDTSILTAVGNDYGFDKIFSRQISALGNVGDIFIGITTSGFSNNILNSFNECKRKGIGTVCLTGNKHKNIEEIVDTVIKVNSTDTATIQELHITIIHLVCGLVDAWVTKHEE